MWSRISFVNDWVTVVFLCGYWSPLILHVYNVGAWQILLYQRVCMCGCVCVYLSGITHSFQTCLSSTLLCVRECVHVCTSECEIPLSVLKPLSGLLPVWRGRRPTHRHARSCHTCMCVCFVTQASVYVSACGYGCASAFGEELYRVMVVIFRWIFSTKNSVCESNVGSRSRWYLEALEPWICHKLKKSAYYIQPQFNV